ncbi:hypothetical protein OBBRIDRAFT_828360 [Obba rivulosa]|uniref:Uncharacterized protein n=1 Tax=Obba rivulosa TaxID=1052685 RepID=A0A8E2DGW3_9APHY|nr:hypothetical protein OBBRIDRAFT_828360 [Obba rivulosa]
MYVLQRLLGDHMGDKTPYNPLGGLSTSVILDVTRVQKIKTNFDPQAVENEWKLLDNILGCMSSPESASLAYKEDTSPQRSPPKLEWTSVLLTSAWFCLLLHAILVGLHVGMVVVWSHHYEHGWTVEDPDTFSWWLTVVLQAANVIITSILVFVTQRVALRRSLYKKETLTALHDRNTAWLGLGSAAVNWCSQFQEKTSARWNVTATTIYLLGIFALHITTPALFSVGPFDFPNIGPMDVNVTFGRPNYPNTSSSYDFVPPYLMANVIPSETLTILPPMSQISGWNTPGLSSNIIYDILNTNSIYATPIHQYTHVNSSAFLGRCGWISQLEQIGHGISQDGDFWQINTTFGQISVPNLYPNVLKAVVAETDRRVPNDISAHYANLILYTPLSVSSSSGQPAQSVELSPPMMGDTLFACNISITSNEVRVSTFDGTLNSWDVPTSMDGQAEWQDPFYFLNETQDRLSALAYEMFLNNTTPGIPLSSTLQGPCSIRTSPCQYLTVIDELREAGISLTPGSIADNMTVPLNTIEYALGELAATVYWFLGRIADSEQAGYAYQSLRGSVTLEVDFFDNDGFRVNLNDIPATKQLKRSQLFAGFATSILLFVLALSLSFNLSRDRGAADSLDSSGVLHLTWLLGYTRPDLAGTLVADVQNPTTLALRRAGNTNNYVLRATVTQETQHPSTQT